MILGSVQQRKAIRILGSVQHLTQNLTLQRESLETVDGKKAIKDHEC